MALFIGMHERYTAVAMYLYDPQAMGRHQPANAALHAAMYYRGLETDDVAASLDVDVQTVRRWLRRESVPTGAHLVALLTLLDAPSALLAEPPIERERALAMMATYDELRAGGPRPDPSQP
jgi:transcriptional regulator with XRE-family HTH domain